MSMRTETMNDFKINDFNVQLNLNLIVFLKMTLTLIFSGALAAGRAAKRSPILIMRKKRKPMSGFSHGYHS